MLGLLRDLRTCIAGIEGVVRDRSDPSCRLERSIRVGGPKVSRHIRHLHGSQSAEAGDRGYDDSKMTTRHCFWMVFVFRA